MYTKDERERGTRGRVARNLERLSGVEPFECAISASPATESRKNRRKKSEVAPTTSEEVYLFLGDFYYTTGLGAIPQTLRRNGFGLKKRI